MNAMCPADLAHTDLFRPVCGAGCCEVNKIDTGDDKHKGSNQRKKGNVNRLDFALTAKI